MLCSFGGDRFSELRGPPLRRACRLSGHSEVVPTASS